MKTVITTLFFFLFTSLFFNASAQIYVNHADTMGANDGSGWGNAYTDLQSALAASPADGEIWVAQGTYTPDTMGGSSASTFLIGQDLELLGGFNGTETNADDRDSENNVTILSGDLNGDDIDDDFVTNRGDNVMTIMRMYSLITNATLIDGFTLRNGHADGPINSQQQKGGAIYSDGAPKIKNCIFKQNYAIGSGGALRQNEHSSQSIILENCLFEKNIANYGGAVYMWSSPFNIKGCDFIGNSTFDGPIQANGGGLWLVNSSGTMENCLIKENYAFEYGGGLHVWNPENTSNSVVEILDCTFDGNTAESGVGGLDFLSFGNNTSYTAKRCTFMNNNSSNGGGMSLNCSGAANNPQFLIDSCYFFQNFAMYNGSALYTILRGNNLELEISNCQFIQNTTSMFSAALDLWGTAGGTGTVSVDACHFEGNTSFWSGALEAGNGWNGGASVDFVITNSSFIDNEATEGGAIGLWCSEESVTNTTLDNCIIQGNKGTERGGAIGLYPLSNDFNVNVSRCQIINNESPYGGAIDGYISDPNVPIPKSISIQFENYLIANNTSDAAVITMESITNLGLTNCTIGKNQSNSIQLSDQSGLTLQNTILYNPGFTEYEDLTDDASVFSNGGNLVGDGSLANYALSTDFQNEDPLFEESGDNCNYYKPGTGSFAINKGMEWIDASGFDLCEFPRVYGGAIDIGAIETDVVSTKQIIAGELEISPNPATDFLNIKLPEAISKPIIVSLFDMQGRSMSQQLISDNQAIDVADLPPGMYLLKAVDDEKIYTGKFVKQ
jgi:Secretion system C-terminal sorting domain/Right handed beta helix region